MQCRNRAKEATRRGGQGPKQGEPPITPCSGQVHFRILCHVNTAGGVIGNSGMIVKLLERDTGAKILFEDCIPSCHERVINVIGFAAINRKINVGEGDYEEASQAQDGLIRVFERLLEVERTATGGIIGCRLLAGNGKIGAVLGRGGKIVDRIRKSTGTKIRVFPKGQLPGCAAPEEELIQIMGNVVAVKKALIAVSRCLQDHALMERTPVRMSSEIFPHLNRDSPLHPSQTFPNRHFSTGLSMSTDKEKLQNPDDVSAKQKVVFRLLCSTAIAGGLIGKGAKIVRALENETGAYIKIAAAITGSKERVATISALEIQGSLHSPAQTATICVFARAIEVAASQGFVSGMAKGEPVTARLLVAANEAHCLIDNKKGVASDMRSVCGAELQLLGGDLYQNCSVADDKIVQIVGDYEKVKSALFEVTGRLRGNLFANMLPNGGGAWHYSHSSVPCISYNVTENTIYPGLDPLIHQMNQCGLLLESGGHSSLGSPPVQTMDNNHMPLEYSAGGLATFGGGDGCKSDRLDYAENRTVVVVVPKQVFGCVYGENGSNLALLKQISSASIIVEDPCDEHEGKVIISGRPDQILTAQSVLQAFISN